MQVRRIYFLFTFLVAVPLVPDRNENIAWPGLEKSNIAERVKAWIQQLPLILPDTQLTHPKRTGRLYVFSKQPYGKRRHVMMAGKHPKRMDEPFNSGAVNEY